MPTKRDGVAPKRTRVDAQLCGAAADDRRRGGSAQLLAQKGHGLIKRRAGPSVTELRPENREKSVAPLEAARHSEICEEGQSLRLRQYSPQFIAGLVLEVRGSKNPKANHAGRRVEIVRP